MQEEKREIEAERSSVLIENNLDPLHRPWGNTVFGDTSPRISGSWTDEEKTTDFTAESLHIHHHQLGFSASALITAFGSGVLAGVVLLAILWTHLPVG